MKQLRQNPFLCVNRKIDLNTKRDNETQAAFKYFLNLQRCRNVKFYVFCARILLKFYFNARRIQDDAHAKNNKKKVSQIGDYPT